jgi:hypothetical protein
MDRLYTNELTKSSFDYFEAHKLALGGPPPKSKGPFPEKEYHPLALHSWLRADWEHWLSNGMNLALPGKPNGLLLIDIDVSAVGREAAWKAYVALLGQIGVAEPRAPEDPFFPQTESPSKGWHVYVKLPDALPHGICSYRIPVQVSDVRPLTEEEKRKSKNRPLEVIGVRYGMYTVAPGSFFDGTAEGKQSGSYTMLCDAAPYDCPPKLIELMREDATTETVPSPNSSRGLDELLAKLSHAISERLNEDVPEGERSEKIAGVIGLLIRTGHSDDEIHALMEAHPIGDKFSGQPTRLRKDIERLRAKGFGAAQSAAQMFGGVVPTLPPGTAPLAPGASLLAPADPALQWAALDKFGNPAAGSWGNAQVLLRRLNIDVRYNAWTERSEISEGDKWVMIEDHHTDKIARVGSDHPYNYRPSESILRRAIHSIARDTQVDPARDLLDRLQSEWDGQQRLNAWLSHACGVPFDAYHQAVSASILLGLVARIRKPGVKFDLMPVFVSEAQGTSKSTLAKMLALNDEWFIENVALGESTKELVLLLGGKSVVEISEMKTRGAVDQVKAMISATHDEARAAFGRIPVRRPRRNIFVGNTNHLEFLEDPTGARRFLPIVVQGEINLNFVREHMPQLVGEAAALQSRGVDINLPREVWGIAGEHQLAATTVSAPEVLLTDWFGGCKSAWISPANLVLLLRQALGRDVPDKVYAPVMRKLGFASKPYRIDASADPVRVWGKGDLNKGQMGFGAQLTHAGRPMVQFVPVTPLMLQTPTGVT